MELDGLYTLIRRMLQDHVDLERRIMRIELLVFTLGFAVVLAYGALFWMKKLQFVAW